MRTAFGNLSTVGLRFSLTAKSGNVSNVMEKIDLQQTTSALPANRLSMTLVLPKYGQAGNVKEASDALLKIASAVRAADPPDRGLCIDLRGVQRLNDPYRKAILNLVKDILKKNVIGLDLRVDKKTAGEVKLLLNEVQKIISDSRSSSVRIKTHGNTAQQATFYWLSYAIGIAVSVVGMIWDKQTVDTKWFQGVSPVVLLGAGLVVLGSLPHIARQYAYFRNRSDKHNNPNFG